MNEQTTEEPTMVPRAIAQTPFSDAEIRTLRDALDHESRAWATYDLMVQDFGPVRPFPSIRDAEARHIGALRGLFSLYGLVVPGNPWPGKVPRYASLQEACAAVVPTTREQHVALVASVPLTREPGWRALREGELIAIRNGAILG